MNKSARSCLQIIIITDKGLRAKTTVLWMLPQLLLNGTHLIAHPFEDGGYLEITLVVTHPDEKDDKVARDIGAATALEDPRVIAAVAFAPQRPQEPRSKGTG